MVNLLPRRGEAQPPPDPDFDALRSEVRDLRAAQIRERMAALVDRVQRTRAECAEHDRRSVGGPCIYCGVSRSFASWRGNAPRLMCPGCDDDRWDHADTEHKSIILNRIITDDWTVRRYEYGQNAQRLIDVTGFRWFCESPGAQPGGWNRWAYLDLSAVRQRATVRAEPASPTFSGGDPCPRCGCAFMWRHLPAMPTAVAAVKPGDRDHILESAPEFGCAGCTNIRDLADVVKQIVGVWGTLTEFREHPLGGTGTRVDLDVPQALGVTWYADRPVRSGERSRKVTLAPFAYLDVDEIRRRAFELFPFQSQWSAHAAWHAFHGARETGR